MAATQCIEASRCGKDHLLKFKPSIRMGKKGDLSDFERGMVFGARRALSKYPVSGSCVDRNALLMSEENG